MTKFINHNVNSSRLPLFGRCSYYKYWCHLPKNDRRQVLIFKGLGGKWERRYFRFGSLLHKTINAHQIWGNYLFYVCFDLFIQQGAEPKITLLSPEPLTISTWFSGEWHQCWQQPRRPKVGRRKGVMLWFWFL